MELLFPASLLVILTTFGVASLFRDDKPYFWNMENRKEKPFPKWDRYAWLNAEFQKQFNSALTDHMPYIVPAKKLYFQRRNSYLFNFQRRTYNFTDYYVHFRNNIYLYGEKNNLFLLYNMLSPQEIRLNVLEKMIQKINYKIENNPNTHFYVYYVTKDDDFRFDFNRSSSCFDSLKAKIALPKENIAQLKIENFAHYKRLFYQTDHHWQCFGSYQGYVDVYNLLRLNEQGEALNHPINPAYSIKGWPDSNPPSCVDGVRPILVSRKQHESKSRLTGTSEMFFGKMYLYCFNFEPMKITIDGEPSPYGFQDSIITNENEDVEFHITYGYLYGSDIGELVFETEREDRPNILVVGDSYDNAVLKLLVGHYHRLYSIDIRHYRQQKGAPFCLDKYIKDNCIDNVLFFGNIGFFTSTEFLEF